MKLRIAPDFTLPPEAVTETFAILGIRGSGKTNTGVVMAEELLAAGRHNQVVIIDPVDVWWGLISSKDGKKRVFDLPVIGGDHADIPLDGGAGGIIADFVTDTCTSVILSLRNLSMNDQRRFAGDFAKRLYERKGQQRSPLMLIVDEADEFVPQRLPHGHEAMFGAFDRLVRRGRSSGIGVTLISQRPQVINKDVLSQVGTLICMRVLHKLDRKALEAWIEAHDTEGRQDEFMGSLASLAKGDAWIWSPSWLNVFERIHIRQRQTYDSSATPKAGDKIAPPKDLAPIDLDALRQRMAATIERAKADDPKELRRKIQELEKALKASPAATPELTAERESAIRKEAARSAHQSYLEPLGDAVRALEKIRQGADQLFAALETAHQVARFHDAITKPSAPKHRPAQPVQPVSRRIEAAQRKSPEASGNGSLSGPEQRILDALAELDLLGVSEAPRVQVAFMAGYTNLNSKGFVNAIGALRTAGHVDYPSSGTVALTGSGGPLARASAAPRSSQELQDRLISMLGGANGRIIRELVSVYPNPMKREELAANSGYTNLNSKGFVNAIGRLRTLGFIEYPQSGFVRARDLLFLEGGR
jgi:hypothetical protein